MGKMKPKSGQISKKNKKKGSSEQGQFLGQIYQGYTDVSVLFQSFVLIKEKMKRMIQYRRRYIT